MPIKSPSTPEIEELLQRITDKAAAYLPETKVNKIKEGYEFAKKAHEGQLRKSGEPYLVHPLRTMEILLGLRVDGDTLVAGILHDVPEDTSVPLSEIEKKFGSKVAYLVDGITKLSKVHYRERMEQRQIESLKKLFIHSAQDLRVILIKLADRLDNMRSLSFIADPAKRERIAKETLEIYVPIANLLGLGEIRSELEDLCFENLYPEECKNLKLSIEENMEERNFILEQMMHITQKELTKNKVDCEIVGRPKTLFSIFKKLEIKRTIYNIDDLIAIRVIVPTRKDCYDVLGIIHKLFKPKIGRFKDYIAVPKPNGYQSLHTTVFGLNGSIVEFQIRTRYMHMEAEYGIAAHYFYKFSGKRSAIALIKQRSSWVQRVLELQKDQKDPYNFLENLKLDIFQDRIFVFTPKGEVVDLPRGASCIDFAYGIHSDIGNHAAKAEINGVVFPITATLGNGDIVNIITDKNIAPELDWTSSVKTALAAFKIKEYLKHEPVEKKLAIGRKYLQKEFDHVGKYFENELTPKRIKQLSKKLMVKNLDALLISIAEGSLNPQNILEEIYEINKQKEKRLFGQDQTDGEQLFKINLKVIGDNGKNQFREITRTLNGLRVKMDRFIVCRSRLLEKDTCFITIHIRNYSELAQVFESIERIEGVEKITRLFWRRRIMFFLVSIFSASLWISQPFLVNLVIDKYASLVSNVIIYTGLALLFGLVLYCKRLAIQSFPEFTETNYYWPMLYGLTTLALLVTFGEIYSFELNFRWIFALLLIFGIYATLTVSYLKYRQQRFR